MTNSKSTKRALLTSIMSILLCFTMLLGTTFAWFTDTVSTTNNIITAGNLDVELYYQNSETSDWTAVGADTNVFKKDTLWEPGHAEVVQLKVVNAGTLDLKYQLGVNVASEIGSKNVANKDFKLSDYIKYAVIDGAQSYGSSKEAAVAAEATANKLNVPYDSGVISLENGIEKIVTLVVYMPTSVGNEANYLNGKDVPTINLGINVFATQLESEEDSFGNEYDADADLINVTVSSEAELVAALAEAKNGDVIGISGNVTWTTGAGIGSTPFETNSKYITLKGVDNNATFTAVGSGVGAVGIDNGTVIFKNLKIVDNSESYAENSWEYGYLEFRGNTMFENCNVVNAIMMEGDSAKFTNCTFNSNKDSEYAVWVSDGKASFDNCTFTGARGLKVHEAYGSEVKSVIVKKCTFNNISKKPGVAIGDVDADTTVSITDSAFFNCQAGDQGLYIYETDTNVANFNFTNKNNVVESYISTFEIATKADLVAFAERVNGGDGMSKVLVKLTKDIDLAGMEWIPVGQTGTTYGATNYFQGIFDGQGHTISNMTISNTNSGEHYAAGFFGFIDAADAKIRSINFDKASVNGHHWTGVVAGYLTGTIDNCNVTNSTVKCTHANDDACGDKAGAIVGYVNSGLVNNCSVTNTTVTAGRDAGQVAGAAKTNYVVNCTATNVTVTATDDCTGANIRNEVIGRVM